MIGRSPKTGGGPSRHPPPVFGYPFEFHEVLMLNAGLENCVEGKETNPNLITNRIIISGEEKMRGMTLFFVTVSIILLATACASPTPAATQAPIQPTQAAAPTQPAPTEAAPTESGPAEETAPAGSGTMVEVTLADNTIDASQTEFQVGVPYTFVITNAGRHAHNFNISTPVSIMGSMQAALDSALLAMPQSQLGPGASVTVDFTFPAESAGQLLEFSCLIRRHYEDGMLLGITVSN